MLISIDEKYLCASQLAQWSWFLNSSQRKSCELFTFLASRNELSLSILLTRCLLFEPFVYRQQRNISWRSNTI